ncbi:hypothetical protein AB6A23_04405 [Paenibacillus tarimensis]
MDKEVTSVIRKQTSVIGDIQHPVRANSEANLINSEVVFRNTEVYLSIKPKRSLEYGNKEIYFINSEIASLFAEFERIAISAS